MDLDGAILPGNAASRSALWNEAAAILSGLIGGGRYGLKIRVPHALGEFWPSLCSFVSHVGLSSASFTLAWRCKHSKSSYPPSNMIAYFLLQ